MSRRLMFIPTAAAPSLNPGVIAMFEIGQSNDVGRADIDGDAVTVPAGCYEYFNSSNSVAALADPTGEAGSTASNGSLQPNLVKRLHELTGKDVYVVKRSLGNTSIFDWKAPTGYIDAAITAFNNFLTYAAAHSITIGYVFIHWLQGENDAGILDADGYITELDNFVGYVKGQIPSASAFLYTRIGYDPNYASSGSSEKIMQAQTAYNYLTSTNAAFSVLTTNQTATFTTGNAKKKADNVHYTLLGLNQVAEAEAQALVQWATYGTKITQPTEPVSALVGISTDTTLLTHYADLLTTNQDWTFGYSSTLNENSGKVSGNVKIWTDLTLDKSSEVSYDADGAVFNGNYGVFLNKELVMPLCTLEFRSKQTATTGYNFLCITGQTDVSQSAGRIFLESDYSGGAPGAAGSYEAIYFYAAGGLVGYWDVSSSHYNFSNFHTFKFTYTSGTGVQLNIDGSNVGSVQNSHSGDFILRWIGIGHPTTAYRFIGTIDYFKIKNF